MRDRRTNLTATSQRGQFQRIERRIRKLDRRRHNKLSRIIHIDVRNIWDFVVSKW
jgi:hypothetical protein